MVHVFVETIRSLIFKIIMFNSWILWWKLHYLWCCSENSTNQVSHRRANCIKGLFSSAHSHDAHLWKWKWRDIRPSMVTHTRNLCSAFTIQSAHTQQWTHTHHEHTPGAVGSHLCCGARGAVGGSVPCSRAPQLWYWGRRECCTFTPPTYHYCRTWDSNSQPLDYESNSLTIRPRLPLFVVMI